MAFDGIFLHFMKNELSEFAVGAKIDKIFFPSKYEIIMFLRTRTLNKKLFISVGGNSPRINFTEYSLENPSKPPMICMLFRKQLSGAVIKSITQAGMDRVLFIELVASNEIGDKVKRTLVIELIAQYSNCILLDENGLIIDSLKRVDASKSSYREILPRREYKLPPPQNKLDILDNTEKEIIDEILSCGEKTLSSAILCSLSGVSPLVSKEIAYRVALGDPKVSELSNTVKNRLRHEIAFLRETIKAGKVQPFCLKEADGRFLEFSYTPLTIYENSAEIIKTATLSEIIDIFYFEREKLQRAKAKAGDLFKTIALLIERTSKKLNIQREELKSCDDMETKKLYAELINANLSTLEKGKSVYELPDFYNNCNIVSVPVQPNLSPSQNSQRYYKEYRKLKTAKKILAEQIEKSAADLEYLLSVRDELDRAETEKELLEIRTELSYAGFVKNKTKQKNKNNLPLPPYEFVSSDGFRIYIGRNNVQNDALSFKKASKNDIWFHVKKAPGSHVILSLEGKEPTSAAMEFAASAAAYFSSVCGKGAVEVDFTEVRNLKKPPASRPGFVIYHTYNTLYVRAKNPKQKG